MVAMAIRAISAAGMGRTFMENNDIYKLETMYETVRYVSDHCIVLSCGT